MVTVAPYGSWVSPITTEVITGRRVVNSVGEGSYEPYTIPKARAAERKEAATEGAAPATSGAPAKVTVKAAAASKKGETAP